MRCCATDPIDGECRDRPSIADGVYGYDSTTGTKENNLAFAEKLNCTTSVPEPTRNPNGTKDPCTTPAYNIISYPFPLMEPREKRLALIAQEQEDEGGGGDYYKASPATGCSLPWEDMLVDADREFGVLYRPGGLCQFGWNTNANPDGVGNPMKMA